MPENDGLKDYLTDYCEPLTEKCRAWALIILPGTMPGIKPKRRKATQRSIIHQWAIGIARKQSVALYSH